MLESGKSPRKVSQETSTEFPIRIARLKEMAGDEGAMMALLQAQEARISAPCLKHVPSLTDTEPLPSVEEMAPETERDALFSATVDAVQIIVRDKLYKARAKSLESYFNVSWHISRAQVYRYLDCASVLDVRPRYCLNVERMLTWYM